jgi:glycosyltransferase involved in cell wall biosynthesis
MRILIANTLYATPKKPKIVGGAEVSVRNLAEALAARGHEVMCIRASAPDESASREEVNGVTVVSLPTRNGYWPFDGSRRSHLRRLLWHWRDDMGAEPSETVATMRGFAPDVVHTNSLAGLTHGVWSVADRLGIPITHTLRDYYLVCPRATRFRNGQRCARSCTSCRFLTSRRRDRSSSVKAAVGNSRATLEIHLSEGLFSRAITRTALPNIADPSASEGGRAPRGSAVVFGYIGRFSDEKGVHLLARAFRGAPGNCELVLAGAIQPDVAGEIQRLAGRPVTLLGFVDPEAFFRSVDVVVVPSLWDEPLPRAILDAQSHGLPVIGSKRGGIPEALGNLAAGWLFEPDLDGDLAALMTAVASDPAALGDKGTAARSLSRRFRATEVCGGYEEVYRSTITKGDRAMASAPHGALPPDE